MTPSASVLRWVHHAVVGENLCPFAKPSLPGLTVHESHLDGSALYDTLLQVSEQLLQQPLQTPHTALVVIPEGLDDFGDFLDVVAQAEAWIALWGLEGQIQLATFHPHYLFDGVPPDDVSHATNRAPFPVLHLIREADMSTAVDRHPDPGRIPERNIAHLRAMGWEGWNALARYWAPSSKS